MKYLFLLNYFQEGNGQWLSLDAELVMTEGEVIGTKVATGHSLLVDCRFELPFGEYFRVNFLPYRLIVANPIVMGIRVMWSFNYQPNMKCNVNRSCSPNIDLTNTSHGMTRN